MRNSQKKIENSSLLKGSIDITVLENDDSNSDRHTLAPATMNLIHKLNPPELHNLLASLNPNTLLSTNETSRLLNLREERIDRLVKLGKLSKDKNGRFLASEVRKYKLEKYNREMKGLQAIAEFFSNA